MGTKKEAIARKAAWSKALAEGRVVRYNGGLSLTSYPTIEQALLAVEVATAVGLDASIVKVG